MVIVVFIAKLIHNKLIKVDLNIRIDNYDIFFVLILLVCFLALIIINLLVFLIAG